MKEILSGIPACSFFMLILVAPVRPQEAGQDTLHIEDPWLALDKLQHAVVSFTIVLSVQYISVNKFDMAEKDAFPISLVSTALTGLFKEIYDSRRPAGHFSKRDLAANGLGLVLASAVVLLPASK